MYITICVIFVSNPLSYAVTQQHTSELLIQVRQYSGEKKQENRMEKELERYQRCVGDEKLNFCRDCLGERAPHNPSCLRRHLSLSIIWLLSQQINQITPASLCAGAASTSAGALALKCMRVLAILSLLFI